MRGVMILGLLLAVWPAGVKAAKIKGAHAACLTEDAMDEFITAAMNGDRRQADALVAARQCVILDGQEYSVVDRGWSISKIRVYAGGGSVLLYVSSSALK